MTLELENGTEVGQAVALEAYEDGSAEWLRQRREGIGGSDAAVVLGYEPFGKSRDDLWERKRGQREFFVGNTATEFGSIIEEYVFHEMVRRGKATSQYRPFQDMVAPTNQFRHPEWGFMRANIDGLLLGPDRGAHLLLEIKSSIHPFQDLSKEHYAQIQHYLGVFGLRGCKYVHFQVPFDRECALEMRRKFIDDEEGDAYWEWVLDKGTLEVADVGRDPGFIDKLRAVEQSFWRCVEDGTHPGSREPEGTVSLDDADLTRRMQELGQLQRKAERIESRIEDRTQQAFDEENLEDRIDELEEALQRELDAVEGSPKKVQFPDGSVASYHNGWGKWDLRPAEPDDV